MLNRAGTWSLGNVPVCISSSGFGFSDTPRVPGLDSEIPFTKLLCDLVLTMAVEFKGDGWRGSSRAITAAALSRRRRGRQAGDSAD